MTILFLSDVPVHRDRVEPLAEVGHTIVVGRDGVEGQALARAVSPDVVVVDRTLPALDGWDYVRILKSDPHLDGSAVVALVVHSSERDRARALASGCAEYLVRPLAPTELCTHLDRLGEQDLNAA